jgi:hypothetical protein
MSDGMTAPAAPQATPQEPIAGAPQAAPEAQKPVDPYDFDLDIKGKPQKLKFENKDQLKAVIQKALYADQVIKDATQAKKGAADLMQKLKTPQGIREVLADPEIGIDIKKFALDEVRAMMEDEKLTPEQREAREYKTKYEKLAEQEEARQNAEKERIANEKTQKMAQQIRGEIIEAMKKFPDIPQNQATMDGIIQNMRAAYKKFNMRMTAEQAMTVYANQYWQSIGGVIDKMTPEQILSRFGQKTLDKIQQLKLKELRDKTNPNAQKPQALDPDLKKKKNLTERDFDKHFQKVRLAGL